MREVGLQTYWIAAIIARIMPNDKLQADWAFPKK